MRIAARGISAGYGRREVIRGVDLCLGAGEFVGLIGPNGAGQSTLLKALSKAIPITSGDLHISGKLSDKLRGKSLAREIAFVPQSEAAIFDFKVIDVVLMGRNPYSQGLSLESPEDYAEAARAMSATDVLHLAERPITELSGGEHRRALIARALAQRAPTLLLDEPTAHLDLAHQRDILALVRRQVENEGTSCLAAIHDLNLAAAYCDRLVLLADGSVLAEGPNREVLREEILTRAFGAGIELANSGGRTFVLPSQPSPEGRNGLKVHVVCGGGSGAEILSMLRRRGHAVTAGVLNLMDSDQLACEALGIQHTTAPPYSAIGRESIDECERIAEASDVLVVAPVPIGPGNLPNLEMTMRLQGRGKSIALLKSGSVASRDFTNGAAERIYQSLIRGGAVSFDSAAAFSSYLESRGNPADPARR